jgi:3-oxoacyl-(acyl-carrier-protein) synthase/malonyl CoA-acyl carrier protein transacylase/NAD(P)-dependent dehydrogenase (short-subunit alcohol dehydrogenase family)
VVFGAESGTDLASAYGFRGLADQYLGGLPEALDQSLPVLTEDSFPGILTNVISGRIANRLDLGGLNFTVDAACASSLAAVDVAIKELVAGTSDMVLCGGADLHNGINDYLLFSAVHALSPRGRCASFDASADGIALGEGIACVVLKRLADARRDGDRVYAVIDAVAGASDGRSLGLTAPRPEGQRRALERAYDQAGIGPDEVGLIEAHGTGTVVGDRTELAVLTGVFEDAGAVPASCALGSVKSQIGHTKCAAGLASLIKAARAVYHGVLPPTINLVEPNPAYDREHSPFRFNTDARPWLSQRRVAGVSAFGFGGTNFHVVLRSPDLDRQPAPKFGVDRWPAELFLLRGENRAAALALGQRLQRAAVNAARYRGGDSPTLRDLAASTWRSGSGPVHLAIVARDLDQLAERLAAALTSSPDGAEGVGEPGRVSDGVFLAPSGDIDPGALALLFPGQGSQRPGMLSELFVTFPGLRKHLQCDKRLLDAMFPPAEFGPEGRKAQSAAITDTRVAQPAMGMAGLAVADLLAMVGVTADLAGGHSYGELVALTVAGALRGEDLVALSTERAEAIVAAAGSDPGAMVAVGADSAAVVDLLADDSAVLANDNSPSQVVVAGSTDAIDTAFARLKNAGISVKRLPVACAFHSPVVAAAARSFGEHLAARTVAVPRFPVWSNSTARPYPSDPAAIRAQLADQIARPVRFREQIESMYESGARTFVEAGPGRVLTGLVKAILGDRPHSAIAVGSDKSDLVGFLSALAELAIAGVPLQAEALFEGRTRGVDLDAIPSVPGWTVNGHLVRQSDGSVIPGGLLPATEQPVVEPPGAGASTSEAWTLGLGPSPARSSGTAPSTSREVVVAEYLRGLREIVASGREVMLQYLGAPGSASSPLESVIDVPRSSQLAPVSVEPSLLEPVGATNGHGSHPHNGARAPAQLSRAALTDIVLATVSERTGYPVDMLEPGLDLEADLGIDSIKRLEIAGELAEQIGFGGEAQDNVDESVIEELVAVKTLDGIVTWLETTLASAPETNLAPSTPQGHGKAGASNGVSPSNGHIGEIAGTAEASPSVNTDVPGSCLRFVPQLVQAEVTESGSLNALHGKEIVITDDAHGIAAALSELLTPEGAAVRVIGNDDPIGAVDVLVHLSGLSDNAGPGALRLFERAQEALALGASHIVAVTALDGALGMSPSAQVVATETSDDLVRFGGMRGALKAVAQEFPGLIVRMIDLDPSALPVDAALVITSELVADHGRVEVGRTLRTRSSVAVIAEERSQQGTDNGVFDLDSNAVVLLTGGARGITARVAEGFADRLRCRIVLAGRTSFPSANESPRTLDATDAIAIRRTLAAAEFGPPAVIEAETRRILAEREVRHSLQTLTSLGTTVDYRSVDVRDGRAVRGLVEDIYRTYGRLDGVIHGAGVLEDCRLADKTTESFNRVFDTKVSSALALHESVANDVRFVVLFASVSGLFGNRGQVDYAAANDALAQLARRWDRQIAGRVMAIDWGPWKGSGMVSPELAREFSKRRVGLLEPQDAVDRLFDELARGVDPEVVLMRAYPNDFVGAQLVSSSADGY